MHQHSQPPPVSIAPWRAGLGLLVVCLGMMAAPLDAAVNVAFPAITAHFALEIADIRWVAVFYVLTYASLLLVCGRLGDLMGHRVVFRAGLLISAIGFAACGLATTYALLLAGRVVQGVGIALVLACAPALATSLYDELRRTRVLGVYGAAMALGHALGPLAAGVLIERFGWAAVYWARLPLMLLALALSFVIPPRRPEGTRAAFDILGGLQLAIALAVMLAGIALVSGPFGWPPVAALVVAGAVLLAAFARRQAQHPTPIIRPAAFLDPLLGLVNAGSIVANIAAFSIVLLVPFHLVDIARLPVGLAGPVLAIGALGIIAGSWLAPRGIARAGAVPTAAAGMMLSSAGLLGVAAWHADSPMTLIAASLLVQGFGYGLFLVAHADYVTGALPVAERGVAGSMTMLTRAIGIAVGAAGLTAAQRHFAEAATAVGTPREEAFLAGFAAVLAGSAIMQALFVVVGALVLWRSRERGRLL